MWFIIHTRLGLSDESLPYVIRTANDGYISFLILHSTFSDNTWKNEQNSIMSGSIVEF